MLPVQEYFQNNISYQRLDIFLSSMELWRNRRKLKTRLLFCYKEYLYDYELYSMIRFLKRNYINIDFIGFSPDERPRATPGFSSEKFFRKLNMCKPDMVFTYEKILSCQEIDKVLDLGIKLMSTTCGVHSFGYGGAKSQPDAVAQLRKHDLYLVPHAPHVAGLRKESINAVEFPFWFDPDWFRPIPTKKIYDILFVGDILTPLNANRLELLKFISQYHQVALISDHDPQLHNVFYVGHTANPRKLNLCMNQAKLVLGSDRLADKKQLNHLPGQYIIYDDDFFIRQRAYPVMGSGACYLVERHPEIERKFEDGEEIVLWDDYEDLFGKVKSMLNDASVRERIGGKARAKCLAEHSVYVRVGQFINLMEGL